MDGMIIEFKESIGRMDKCKLLLEKVILLEGEFISCLIFVKLKTTLKLSYVRIFLIVNCHIPIGWGMVAFAALVSCMQLASALIFLSLPVDTHLLPLTFTS